LNDHQIFSSAPSAIESDGKYYLTGATEDTVNQSWRWVFFMQLSDSGFVDRINYLGDYSHDYYPAWPGSFQKQGSRFVFAGNKIYYGPYNEVGVLANLNSNLDTIWLREYYGDLNLPFDSIQQINNISICSDGGIICTGRQYTYQQSSKMLLLRTDSTGSQLWKRCYGITGLNNAYSVIQTTDGGFAIGGFWYIPGSSVHTGDPIIIKTDSMGNQEWQKNIGGPYQDNSANLCLSPDGSIIAGTMYADSLAGDVPYSRIHIVKMDNTGNIIWDKKYDRSNIVYNYMSRINCLDDGSIIACGSKPIEPPRTSSWAMKVSSEGDSLWYRHYDNLHGYQSFNYLYDIIPTSDNGFLTCGYVFPMQPDTGTQDAWVLKLDSMGCDTPGCFTVTVFEQPTDHAPRTTHLQIFPNPAVHYVNIRSSIFGPRSSIFIYDLFGRKQDEIIIPKGQNETKLDISAYPPGVYIAVLKNEKGLVSRGKFVKSGDR